jgi:hypothetical protein
MLIPQKCDEVSRQCPQGQEDGYQLGWYHGQINMTDKHDGTPCQVIRLEQEIDRMHLALSQIIDSDDLDFIKARAVAALPET